MTAERLQDERTIKSEARRKLTCDFQNDGIMMVYFFKASDRQPMTNLYLTMQGKDYSMIVQADEEDIDLSIIQGNATRDYLINEDGVCEVLPTPLPFAEDGDISRIAQKHRSLDQGQAEALYEKILSAKPDKEAIKEAYAQFVDAEPGTQHYFVWIRHLPGGLPFPLPFPDSGNREE